MKTWIWVILGVALAMPAQARGRHARHSFRGLFGPSQFEMADQNVRNTLMAPIDQLYRNSNYLGRGYDGWDRGYYPRYHRRHRTRNALLGLAAVGTGAYLIDKGTHRRERFREEPQEVLEPGFENDGAYEAKADYKEYKPAKPQPEVKPQARAKPQLQESRHILGFTVNVNLNADLKANSGFVMCFLGAIILVGGMLTLVVLIFGILRW